MTTFTKTSLVLAGLMAIAGASQAQSTTNVPAKAGEASTMTNGVPNAKTTNTPGSEGVTTKDQARMDAQGRSKASATTSVPGRAGEASTMVKGNPNADPDSPMLTKSKSERKMEKEMKKADRKQARDIAVMGQKGAQVGAEAGTPQNSPAGNPSVFKGGTPK
jgi:hypothetical protein